MGTVSVKMPDEEIEKLERLAESEGKTKSSFMREMAETELEERSATGLRELVGVLSSEEAEELREGIKEMREEMDEDVERRIEAMR
ncbi:MAG: ribbon-helix-helix protein, CopG family [Candidatus Nanohaloarchaea archaeon]|nr:ribbon-helix-helix protein, CopG family [Candidatus Nanohaloarchaea archaeon]